MLLRVLLTLSPCCLLFGVSIMFSSSLYFTSRLFCSLVIPLLVCVDAFTPYLLVDFFPFIWNVLFNLYCFILSRYLFNIPSLASTFWFISLSCIFCFDYCVAFLFSCQSVKAFFSVLSFLLEVVNFLFVFPVEFPFQILSFRSYFLKNTNFFADYFCSCID